MIRFPAPRPTTVLMVALVALGLVARATTSAHAEADARGGAIGSEWSSSSSSSSSSSIEIVVVGTASDLDWIRGAVRSRGPDGAAPAWTSTARFEPRDILGAAAGTAADRAAARDRGDAGAVLRCWVDLSDARRARLYFAARAGARFLVRDVELSGQRVEVDRQSLSQVLELSIAALLDSTAAALTRDEAKALLETRAQQAAQQAAQQTRSAEARAASRPPVAPVEQPARATSPAATTSSLSASVSPSVSASAAPSGASSTAGLRGGIFYAVEALGSGLPIVHGPGLSLSWGVAAADRWQGGVFASGLYQFPEQNDGPSVSMRFQTVGARAGVELGRALRAAGPPQRAVIRLGFGADFVRVSPAPGTVDSSAVLRPTWWSSSLVVSGGVAYGRTIGSVNGRKVELTVHLFADVLPTVIHYDLQDPSGTSPAFSPWRVRPGLSLELGMP